MQSDLDYEEEHVIIVEVYKEKLVGKPFVRSAVLTHLDKTFLDLLRTTLSKEKPSFMYSDTNVTSCSTHDGTSMNTLLSKPLSLLLEVIERKQHKILRYVVNTTQPQLESNTPNIFDQMVQNANKESFLKSKYSQEDVDKFLIQYHTAESKKVFLKKCIHEKITFDEQIKQRLYTFLEENKLGYKGADEKHTLQVSMNDFISVLLNVQRYHDRFRVKNLVMFQNDTLLDAIKNCVPTKIEKGSGRSGNLKQHQIDSWIKILDKARCNLPSRYLNLIKNEGGKRRGEILLNTMNNIRNILTKNSEI